MKEPLVLLVEDNPHIMDINTAALTMRGCRVLQAATVQACREQLRLHDVELIVLDILLPDGDGLTLCREIKENYDIPILFLSAIVSCKILLPSLVWKSSALRTARP